MDVDREHVVEIQPRLTLDSQGNPSTAPAGPGRPSIFANRTSAISTTTTSGPHTPNSSADPHALHSPEKLSEPPKNTIYQKSASFGADVQGYQRGAAIRSFKFVPDETWLTEDLYFISSALPLVWNYRIFRTHWWAWVRGIAFIVLGVIDLIFKNISVQFLSSGVGTTIQAIYIICVFLYIPFFWVIEISSMDKYLLSLLQKTPEFWYIIANVIVNLIPGFADSVLRHGIDSQFFKVGSVFVFGSIFAWIMFWDANPNFGRKTKLIYLGCIFLFGLIVSVNNLILSADDTGIVCVYKFCLSVRGFFINPTRSTLLLFSFKYMVSVLRTPRRLLILKAPVILES